MAQSKMFRVTMMCQAGLLHDLMSMQEMRGVQIVDVQAVKHGGVDEETGAMRPTPTSREFILAYAVTHGAEKPFRVLDLGRAAEEAGLSKAGVKQAATVLTNDGLLRRVEQGVYVITRKALANVERTIDASQGKAPPKKNGKFTRHQKGSGETIQERVITFIRSKQNGSGDGVPRMDIIEAVKGASGSVGSALARMAKDGTLNRVGDGLYRVGA